MPRAQSDGDDGGGVDHAADVDDADDADVDDDDGSGGHRGVVRADHLLHKPAQPSLTINSLRLFMGFTVREDLHGKVHCY